MAKLIDIQNSIQTLNKIIELRDSLIDATPLLTNLNDTLTWYGKTYSCLPAELGEKLLANVEPSVLFINEIKINPFSYGPLTSATGSFAAVSGDTKNILIDGGNFYNLIKEYENINSLENQFNQALVIINKIDGKLTGILEEAKQTFQLWKGEVKSDSDLAKDLRAFQDHFKGFLHKIRLNIDGKKAKDFSWPKMAEVLAKSGSGHLQRLKSEQVRHEKTHLAFTEIFKRTKICTDKE